METYLGEADERVIVIVADGGLNSGTAAQIEEVVQRAVDCGMRGVIVDCSKLDIISSAGLSRLLMLHKRMRQHGGEVRIAGLKGMAVGGAEVSTRHANFIVNRGGATASDIEALVEAVRKRVLLGAGIDLVPEVRIVGDA